jgi:hypothetical protein
VQYLLSLIIPIFSYLLQVYPRFFNKYFGVDVWTRLLEVDIIRKNHYRIPNTPIRKGFIFEGYFDYPPVFILFLSLFSKNTLEKHQGLIAPFFDALLNISVFFIAFQLTNNIQIALVAQLIYTLTPVVVIENSSLVPRSIGYLMFSLAFYFLLLYSNLSSNIMYLLIGLNFSVLTILTHRFATQSLLFISIFFAVIEKSPIYIFSFIASIIIAIIVSKGYYLRVLKTHITNIIFWSKNSSNRFAHQVYGHLPPTKNPDLVGIIYKLLSGLAPITLLISNVWILSAFLLFFPDIPKTLILEKMAIWAIFFYILSILVLMIKFLIPIGEGYRYIEMTQVPTAILASYIFYYFYNSVYKTPSMIVFVFIILLNLAVVLLIQYKAIIKDKNRSFTKDMQNVCRFINKLRGTPRIMCLPHQITTMTAYNTKADVLVGIDSKSVQYMGDFYPVLKKPISELAKRYKLDYLLLRESFAKLKDLKIKSAKVVYRSGDIVLVSL